MKKNVAGQKVRFSLFKNGARINNPTIVAGDAKVDLDGAGQGNVNTAPTSDAAGLVTWSPTQAETNADVVSLLMLDAAGSEWDPVTQVFYTEMETSVASILVDTAEIGAAGAGLTALGDARIANLDATVSSRATAASIAALNDLSVADIMTDVVEGALTFEQMLRIFQAVLAGKSNGGGTNVISFRDVADSKARVTATVDANGNRTGIVVDGT